MCAHHTIPQNDINVFYFHLYACIYNFKTRRMDIDICSLLQCAEAAQGVYIGVLHNMEIDMLYVNVYSQP